MKKRLLHLSAMFVFLISILTTSVNAFLAGPIKSLLKEEGIFYYILMELPKSDAGAKLIFGILILTIMYGVAKLVFTKFAPNLQFTIALLIALISAFAMPASILKQVSLLWGGIIYSLFIAAPVLGLFYLLFTSFKEPTRGNYAIKFGIASILTYISNFVGGGEGEVLGVKVEEMAFFKAFDFGFGILGLVAVILLFYYIIKMVSPGEGTHERAAEHATEARDKVRGWLGGRPGIRNFKKHRRSANRQMYRGYRTGERLEKTLNDAKALYCITPADMGKYEDKLKKAKTEAEDMLGVTPYLNKLLSDISAFPDDLKDSLEDAISNIELYKKTIDVNVVKVKDEIDKLIANATGGSLLSTNDLKRAIKDTVKIVQQTNQMMADIEAEEKKIMAAE
ncbi:hypothetical protein KY343_06790 [Candidatus Woesearchaeota archaeon]|nr:hypothetical protein [Candidatus Woesearchaeota archaeon]